MTKLVFSIVGFVLLCGLVFGALHDRGEPAPPAPPPPDHVLEAIQTASDDLARVETALERANYGEATHALTRLRVRLDDLRHLYVEQRVEQP